MEQHRKVWMESNCKDEEWMYQASQNGFDVHHLDGDHSNNDPENLVMIFASDHMRLHNAEHFIPLSRCKKNWNEESEGEKLTRGEFAYKERLKGLGWKEIECKNPILLAKNYAIKKGMEWPIKLSKEVLAEGRDRRKRARLKNSKLGFRL